MTLNFTRSWVSHKKLSRLRSHQNSIMKLSCRVSFPTAFIEPNVFEMICLFSLLMVEDPFIWTQKTPKLCIMDSNRIIIAL